MSSTVAAMTEPRKRPLVGQEVRENYKNQQPAEKVFQDFEQKLAYYRERVVQVEDALIDLACAKHLPIIARNKDYTPRELNHYIATLGLNAITFCERLGVDREDFMDQVAERLIPLSRYNLAFDTAQFYAGQTVEGMEILNDWVPIHQVSSRVFSSYDTVNQRIAIVGLQALLTLKEIGVGKDLVVDTLARMLSGVSAEIACQKAEQEVWKIGDQLSHAGAADS